MAGTVKTVAVKARAVNSEERTIMDRLSVKWIQVITISGEWRQASAPPARDFGDDFTAPTLNQAEKTKSSS